MLIAFCKFLNPHNYQGIRFCYPGLMTLWPRKASVLLWSYSPRFVLPPGVCCVRLKGSSVTLWLRVPSNLPSSKSQICFFRRQRYCCSLEFPHDRGFAKQQSPRNSITRPRRHCVHVHMCTCLGNNFWAFMERKRKRIFPLEPKSGWFALCTDLTISACVGGYLFAASTHVLSTLLLPSNEGERDASKTQT